MTGVTGRKATGRFTSLQGPSLRGERHFCALASSRALSEGVLLRQRRVHPFTPFSVTMCPVNTMYETITQARTFVSRNSHHSVPYNNGKGQWFQGSAVENWLAVVSDSGLENHGDSSERESMVRDGRRTRLPRVPRASRVEFCWHPARPLPRPAAPPWQRGEFLTQTKEPRRGHAWSLTLYRKAGHLTPQRNVNEAVGEPCRTHRGHTFSHVMTVTSLTQRDRSACRALPTAEDKSPRRLPVLQPPPGPGTEAPRRTSSPWLQGVAG